MTQVESVRPGRRVVKLVAVVVLCGVAAAVAVAAWHRRHRIEAAQYVTAPVTVGAVGRTVTASGTVNPVAIVQVGTYVSGVIQSIHCDYNTEVKKGQLCAKIDPGPYQSGVDQDQANLDAAKAQLDKDQTSLDYAQLTYQRTLDLSKKGLVAQDAVDQSRSTAEQARAQVALDRTNIQQRQAALDSARINLGYTNIVSPVNGTVVSRNVTTGQTVAASFQTPTLFLIATDLTRMQVDTNVSEGDIGGITPDRPASFTVDAFPNHPFEGKVTQVRQAPQTVQNVVTYDVVVSVANPELLLKPGMTATVRVTTDKRDQVMRVPDQALRFVPGGVVGTSGNDAAKPRPTDTQASGQSRVWILQGGRAVDVDVTPGLRGDSYTEVVGGGLKPGDQVIVSEQGGPSGQGAPSEGRQRLLRF